MRKINHWGDIAIVRSKFALDKIDEGNWYCVVKLPRYKSLKGVKLETIYDGYAGTYAGCLKYIHDKYGIDTRRRFEIEWEEFMEKKRQA